MTFEEYWNKRALDEGDMVNNLWKSKNSLANVLFHFLKDFAQEVWKVATESRVVKEQ